MAQSSGPGKVVANLHAENIQGLLYNFDVGSYLLKPEHCAWLDEFLLPFVGANSSFPLRLAGNASATGTQLMNFVLSLNRVATGEAYLLQKGLDPSRHEMEMVAHGSDFAMKKLNPQREDERDRNIAFTLTVPWGPVQETLKARWFGTAWPPGTRGVDDWFSIPK
ncbi:MAG: OmpA family protein [Isosphaeraceae bacterium]|nr:OmpA family protein [Isosphaeraceae bacterium]